MNRTLFRILACALCIGFLVAACGGTGTPVRPTATPAPPRAGAAPSLFAADHVIMTGPEGQISTVLTAVKKYPPAGFKEISFVEKGRRDLAQVKPPLGTCGAALGCLAGLANAQMHVYQILDSGQPLTDTIRAAQVISSINGPARGENCVFADPVYRTGMPPNPLDGDPWIAEGSPWIAEGSPFGGTPIIPFASASDAFLGQWALRSGGSPFVNAAGIGLMSTASVRTVAQQGDGIRVGVFDTSPVAQSTNIDWATPPFRLQVDTLPAPQPLDQFAGTLPPRAGIRDHGLFVAGLVHAVAPASEIRLYRVLDDYGRGDLWMLNASLQAFMADALAGQGKPIGAVINLSLGVHPDSNPALGLPPEVTSLKTLVTAAFCQGIVVVAASGNDSAPSKASAVKPAQIPASFDPVIAVAASNSAGGRACYSNRGEVAAPGGELTDHCTGELGLPSVISLMLRPASSQTGYGYWAGTSFSAPLVSGLAALAVQKAKGNGFGNVAGGGEQLARGVALAIMSSASPTNDPLLGSGIISVTKTLSLP